MRTIGPQTGEDWMKDVERRLRHMQQGLGVLARDKALPSDQRPDPADTVAGDRYFDTTLGMPLWSDGTQWVDATGTPAT